MSRCIYIYRERERCTFIYIYIMYIYIYNVYIHALSKRNRIGRCGVFGPSMSKFSGSEFPPGQREVIYVLNPGFLVNDDNTNNENI